jgi:hypothetical protein
MFHSRKIDPETKKVEVWECEWENKGASAAKKKYLRKISDNNIKLNPGSYSATDAVCWAPGRTIGNIAVCSVEVLGSFSNKAGEDAVLPCQIVPAGKFRHGSDRWYCKTHQIHWGTKADFASAALSCWEIRCSNHAAKMSYVIEPFEIAFKEFEEIGIWCSLPPGISNKFIGKRAPKIHVHKRFKGGGYKEIDRDFDALMLSYNQDLALFENTEITKIQVTPPAAFEFVRALEENRPLSCVSCKKCRYPHLDLGDFAQKEHRKHFCGNCGNDSIWSKEPIVSTPLKPLHDQFHNCNTYVEPDRMLDMDSESYKGLDFEIWASSPAVVWTANRPQEKGIHVHIYDGENRVVDDTYGAVIKNGVELARDEIWRQMVKNTIY